MVDQFIPRGPVHLIANVGDRRTVCGARDSSSEPAVPYVLARHAPRHVAGWGMTVCPGCQGGLDAAASEP